VYIGRVHSKVAIVGQGYVGLPLAIAIAKAGHSVIGFDINSEVIKNLRDGKSHIEGVNPNELSQLIKAGNYWPSSNETDLHDREIAIIAVPTPLSSHRLPDLKYVIAASETIGRNLKSSALIVNESTSFPGTLRSYIKTTVDKFSSPDLTHSFAISPERVDPGNEKWHIENTPRIVAGLTPSASEQVYNFYSTFCKSLMLVSSPEVAEAAKLFENTFRLVNIGLVNEFARIMHALDIPVRETLDAAATKPYGFMKFIPGLGVGGHCIPVDPLYLAEVAHKVGEPARFIEEASHLNQRMPNYVVSRIKKDNDGTLQGKTVLVIGVSYKPNLADTRETPVESLLEELKVEGSNVLWHDPYISDWRGTRSVPISPLMADITIVATYHSIFSEDELIDSANYVFDCTGNLSPNKKVVQL
jgi:UDP-N-acetyl-D-glucosamine dehydrogenase